MIKRTYSKVGELLKKEISQGVFKVGDKLPTERDISERLGISRTIVREAIVMLEVEKLVEVKKGSGVYVIDTPMNIKNNEVLDIGPFELLQARQIVESSIAEFAAQQATKRDILRLKEILNKEKEMVAKNIDDYTADRDFHLTLAEITQNDVLIKFQEQLWEFRFNSVMWIQLHKRILEKNYHHLWLKDHHEIFLGIQKKNSLLAKQSMWRHLENVKQKLFELSDVEDPNFDGYLFNITPVGVKT